jgi:4-amino-4-deoxy-L-arabinose transferase-like glycosyltransferase
MTRSRALSWAAVAAVFAAALGVRLVKLNEPPLDFHPTRQFRSALLARRFFLEADAGVPAWRLDLARANASEIYEPPLMERAAALGYRLRGREDLRIPRALSIACWLVAGALVHASARRIAGTHGALVAAGFFLLAPFGVEASRSFQPDPAMVMWIAATMLALLVYGERPRGSALAAAGACGALAVLVKPMAAFLVGGAFAGVWTARRRDLGRRAPWHAAAFLAMVALPMAPWYLPRFAEGGSAAAVARISFHPGLLLTAPFWIGWTGQVWKTCGLVAPLAAAVGIALVRDRATRAVLAGLGAGYVACVVAFTYQASTHDYYHLPLMPLAAAGLAPLVERGLAILRDASGRPRHVLAIASAVFLAACADAALTSRSRLRARQFAGQVGVFREVGSRVGHGPSNVLLADDYGYPLKYYGELGGSNWPRAYDLPLMRLLGEPAPDAATRLRALVGSQRPRFFVVTVPQDLASQPDLGALLERDYARHAAGGGYVVYDLTRPNP